MNNQQVYGKIFNVTNNKGNADQNHNETIPHTCLSG